MAFPDLKCEVGNSKSKTRLLISNELLLSGGPAEQHDRAMARGTRSALTSTPGTTALKRYSPVSGFRSMSPAAARNTSYSAEVAGVLA